jgi:hypothetical protein
VEVATVRSISILTVAISLVVLSAASAWSQPVQIRDLGAGNHFFIEAGGGFPPVIIPPIMMGLQAAHLTADQQNKVDQIMASNRSQIHPLIQQLHSVHEQIANKLLTAGTVTASDLAPLEDQAAKLDAQIQQQALNAAVQVRDILTPAQVTQMAQFHQKMTALQAQMRSLMSEASQQPTSEPTP